MRSESLEVFDLLFGGVWPAFVVNQLSELISIYLSETTAQSNVIERNVMDALIHLMRSMAEQANGDNRVNFIRHRIPSCR